VAGHRCLASVGVARPHYRQRFSDSAARRGNEKGGHQARPRTAFPKTQVLRMRKKASRPRPASSMA
jgi:hypothetical protein